MNNEVFDSLSLENSFITSLNHEEVVELYNEVNKYVTSNFLCDGADERYYVKYHGKFYQVGYIFGPEMVYFAKLIKDNSEVDTYVEYDSMKNNTLSFKEMKMKSLFNDINDNIYELQELGASKQLIMKSIKIK